MTRLENVVCPHLYLDDFQAVIGQLEFAVFVDLEGEIIEGMFAGKDVLVLICIEF